MNKIQVLKEGSMKKVEYTIRFIMFDPKKHFVSTQEAKDLCRKEIHCSKKKMNEEYDSVWGVWMKIGRGKKAHIEFNKTTKTAANVIFIVPKKYKIKTWKILQNVELPYDLDCINRAFKS